jgi:hypothetical protein
MKPFSPRKCTSHADDFAASKVLLDAMLDSEHLTVEQRENVWKKRLFLERLQIVLSDEESVRSLALFFGVKRSTLHERMRAKRTDLAPLDSWFEKLDRYEAFEEACDEFMRTA